MASLSDDGIANLLRQFDTKLELIVKMLAIQQEQIRRMKKYHIVYDRNATIKKLKVEISKLKDYIRELEIANRLPTK